MVRSEDLLQQSDSVLSEKFDNRKLRYVETFKLGDNLGDCLALPAGHDSRLRQAGQGHRRLPGAHPQALLEPLSLRPDL